MEIEKKINDIKCEVEKIHFEIKEMRPLILMTQQTTTHINAELSRIIAIIDANNARVR